VLAGREDARRIGIDGYLETRYEELVAGPEAELRTIAVFLALEYSSTMANFYVGKTRSKTTLSAKSAWLPPTPGLRDWRTSMPERDLVCFEALAGDLLEQLGYVRAVPSIPKKELVRASQLRQRFAEESRTASRVRGPRPGAQAA